MTVELRPCQKCSSPRKSNFRDEVVIVFKQPGTLEITIYLCKECQMNLKNIVSTFLEQEG